MSFVTRLEAGYSNIPGEQLFRVRYPTGGTWYTIQLTRGFYPHRQALLEAIQDAFDAESLPITIVHDFPGRCYRLASSGSNFDLEFTTAEGYGVTGIRQYMGLDATYSNVDSITGSACDCVLHLPDSPTDEVFTIVPNRVANFSDDGRVGAALINRSVRYSCTLTWDYDHHDVFRSFWAWVAQSRKLCFWRRFDSAGAAINQYVANPLLGDAGFKWLALDRDTSNDLDAPTARPLNWGNTKTISGVIYGI